MSNGTEKMRQDRKSPEKSNAWKATWKKVCAIMAAVVVFATTYALILPALTLESESGDATYVAEEETTTAEAENTQTAIVTIVDDTSEAVSASGSTLSSGTEDGAYTVEISYDDDAGIPDDAVLQVELIEEGADEEQEAALLTAVYGEDAVTAEAAASEESDDGSAVPEIISLTRLNITILSDDEEIEPASEVEVVITTSVAIEIGDDQDLSIVHITGDGDAEYVENIEVKENVIAFVAESFSEYDLMVTAPSDFGDGQGNGGGNNQQDNDTELDLESYNKDAYVHWDTMTNLTYDSNGTITGASSAHSYASTWIESVTLNSISVTNGDSASSTQSSTTQLSTYFTSASTTYEESGTITITPQDGYYVTAVVIACCGTQGTDGAYACKTWNEGNAYNAEFEIDTSGSITIDVTSLDFSHSSSSSHYYILIACEKIPTPLYVEYSYGDIVDILAEEGLNYSTFATADGWTTEANGNVYTYAANDGTDGGVKTDYVQYKYTYDSSDDNASSANWKHYANSITDEAVSAAAAAGYVFVGWKVTYYTSCTACGCCTSCTEMSGCSCGCGGCICDEGQTTNGSYESDTYGGDGNYYNYDYTFSNVYGYAFAEEGDQVALITHAYLEAVWIKVEVEASLKISKTTKGTSAPEGYHYTFTITSTDTTTADGETTYDIDGTYDVTYTGTDNCASLSDHLSTITFKNGSASLSLANGEAATIDGITSGINVTIEESDEFTSSHSTYISTSVTVGEETSENVTNNSFDDESEGDEGDGLATSAATDADSEDNDSGDDNSEGSDSEDNNSEDDSESDEETNSESTYNVTTTIPTPTNVKVNTSATTQYDEDGNVTGFTYSYEITSYTQAIRVVSYTNVYEDPVSLTIQKVDENGNVITSYEASFTLSDGEKTIWYDGSGTEHESEQTLTTSSGVLSLSGLYSGSYLLTETQAPNGYNILSESIGFKIDSDGVVTLTSGTGSIATLETGADDDGNTTYTMKVVNTSGDELPNTGGPGTNLLTFAGLLLMLLTLLMFGYRGRARGKEGV